MADRLLGARQLTAVASCLSNYDRLVKVNSATASRAVIHNTDDVHLRNLTKGT